MCFEKAKFLEFGLEKAELPTLTTAKVFQNSSIKIFLVLFSLDISGRCKASLRKNTLEKIKNNFVR